MLSSLWSQRPALRAGIVRADDVSGDQGRTRGDSLLAQVRAMFSRSRALPVLQPHPQHRDEGIRTPCASLAYNRHIIEQASAAARLGVWLCELPDERLHWTDGTYDLFDLPRGTPLDRQQILACYSAGSREALDRLRSAAIAERSGFTMDAEITTPRGQRRWIRLTATVECQDDVPLRIFGIKQDITEEKEQWDRTRYLAEFDVMTGLANRGQFQARLAALCGRRSGMLLLVDLDGFKEINDRFGHIAGDECLREAAARLAGVCGDAELVARVGGDEFAVLLGARADRRSAERLADRIVRVLSESVVLDGCSFSLGASVGLARCNGGSPAELFRNADMALYEAKAAGRSTYRVFETRAA